MFSWLHPKRTPIVIAHRGSSAVAPENTLAAFQQSIADGADAIELDVQLTRDGEVVVFHDNKLDRTTDGRGRLQDYTLADLKSLSAGSWFHPKFATERIPTLGETLDLLHGKVGVNIEIKVDRRSKLQFDLAERCCTLIRRHHVQHSVMVSSFSHRIVSHAKTVLPHLATGFLYHPVRHIAKSPIARAQLISADYLILSGTRMRKWIVRLAQQKGLRVAEYTVNTPRRMERILRFGLDAFFTDNPASMRKFLYH